MDIPKDKISDGYRKAKRHVKSLLDSSEILYNSGQYTTSLALSILAREEHAKLLVIQDKLKEKEKISHEEWEVLTKNTKKSTSHRYRLTSPTRKARETVQSFSEDEYEQMQKESEELGITKKIDYNIAKNLTSDYEKNYEQLDKIKQECLYLGWENNWSTLAIKLGGNELQGLAYTHLMEIKSNYYSAISMRIHKTIQPPIGKTLKDDLNFQTWLKIEKERQTPKSKKLAKLGQKAILKLKGITI